VLGWAVIPVPADPGERCVESEERSAAAWDRLDTDLLREAGSFLRWWRGSLDEPGAPEARAIIGGGDPDMPHIMRF